MDLNKLVYKVFAQGLLPKAAFDPVMRQIMTFSTVASCCPQKEQNEMDLVPLTQ